MNLHIVSCATVRHNGVYYEITSVFRYQFSFSSVNDNRAFGLTTDSPPAVAAAVAAVSEPNRKSYSVGEPIK